jgi:hypothetical protein
MIRALSAVVLLLATASLALAQLRTIPPDAKRGKIRHVQDMVVTIDGTPKQLAPGAQIRDVSNRLVLPLSVPADAIVKYSFDAQGMVRRVWLLTPLEVKASEPPPQTLPAPG